MEGYKYRQNEKGIPVPLLEEGIGAESDGLVPRSIKLLFDQI